MGGYLVIEAGMKIVSKINLYFMRVGVCFVDIEDVAASSAAALWMVVLNDLHKQNLYFLCGTFVSQCMPLHGVYLPKYFPE